MRVLIANSSNQIATNFYTARPMHTVFNSSTMNSEEGSSDIGGVYEVALTQPDEFLGSWDRAWHKYKKAILAIGGIIVSGAALVLGSYIFVNKKEITFKEHTNDVLKTVLKEGMNGKFLLNNAQVNSLISGDSYKVKDFLKGGPDWRVYIGEEEKYKKDLKIHLENKMSDKHKEDLWEEATGKFMIERN